MAARNTNKATARSALLRSYGNATLSDVDETYTRNVCSADFKNICPAVFAYFSTGQCV